MSLTMQPETGTSGVGRSQVNVSVLSFGVWAALLYPGLLGIGWVGLAGFVPPPNPSAPPQVIVDLFLQHTNSIRLGMVVCMFGAAMALPLGATVAYLISRVEGFVGPLTLLQVMGAVGMAVITFYPPMWWLAGLYRADVNPAEVTRMVNDLCWFGFIGGLTIYYPTILTMAVAALIDKSGLRPFPRWFGYLNLFLAVLLLPSQAIFFFKPGPLAWNGLIAFYLAVGAFSLWFPIAFVVLRRAVAKVRAEQEVAAAAGVAAG